MLSPPPGDPVEDRREHPLAGLGAFAAKLAAGSALAVIVALLALRLAGGSLTDSGVAGAEPGRSLPAAGRGGPPTRAAPPAPAPAASAMVADGGDAKSPVARDVERRHESGELSEAQRRFEACPGGDLRRVAWIDRQQRVQKLIRYRAGGAVVEEWFDDAGRLREALMRTIVAGRPWQRRVLLDERGRESVEDATPGLAPEEPPPALVAGDPTSAFFSGPGCEQR